MRIAMTNTRPTGRSASRFVGVWDTVAAVGLPFKELTDFWNAFIHPFKFPDFKLSPQVQAACQALAIDDERHTFSPMMWDEESEEDKDRIEQVWFAGVHSNVGGGYPKQGMSLVALDWMMRRAELAGLRFVESERERYFLLQNVHDKLYNSRSGPKVFYRYKPRDVAKICADNHVEPQIHVTALERLAHATQGYAPGNLPATFTIATTDPAWAGRSEDPEQLADVIEKLGGKSPTEPMLLGETKVRNSVAARKLAHFALVLGALAIVISAIVRPVDDRARPWGPDWFADGLQKFCGILPMGDKLYHHVVLRVFVDPLFIVLPLALGLVFIATRLARRSLGKSFVAFWRERLQGPWWD